MFTVLIIIPDFCKWYAACTQNPSSAVTSPLSCKGNLDPDPRLGMEVAGGGF